MAQNQLGKALNRAWPDGVPASEKRLFGLLPAESQALALDRLEVLLDVAERKLGVSAGADRLGISRPTFDAVRKKWAAERSIASIVQHVGRAGRRAEIGDDQLRQPTVAIFDGGVPVNSVLPKAWELVEEYPEASNGDLSQLLIQQTGSMSRPTATKLIQRLRREDRLRPDVLSRNYGHALLFDVSAMGLLTEAAGVTEPIIGSFLVERASGLIIGSWAGTRATVADGMMVTLSRGLAFLRDRHADRHGVLPARLRFVAPPLSDERNADLGRRLEHVLDGGNLSSRGNRRFGSRLTSLLGRRIGRLELRPASTPVGSPLPQPNLSYLAEPLLPEVADGLLGDHVAKHNGPIESRLFGQGLIGTGDSERRMMAQVIEPVLEALHDV